MLAMSPLKNRASHSTRDALHSWRITDRREGVGGSLSIADRSSLTRRIPGIPLVRCSIAGRSASRSRSCLSAPAWSDETMIDGRTVKIPRSIIDHRLIDHAGLSGRPVLELPDSNRPRHATNRFSRPRLCLLASEGIGMTDPQAMERSEERRVGKEC